MSRRFVQLIRNLFARPTTATRPARRTTLRCNALEDRTVPTVVSVSAVVGSNTTEGNQVGVFRFTLDSALSSDLTVSYNVMGGSADSPDYTGLGSSVVIPQGETSVDVPVTATRDNEVESGGDESVTIELYDDFMPYTKDPMATTATLMIADDPPMVSVAASKTSVAEGGQVTFTFSRTGGDTAQALDVSYMLSGDATDTDDYTGLSSSVTIPAGKTSATVTMTAKADNEVEGDEEVWVDVTAGSAYDVTGGGAIVTIADDPPVVSVAASKTSVAEGGTVTFTVSRTGGNIGQALNVSLNIGGDATSGDDYTGLGTSVTIAAGKDSVDVPVSIKRDNVVDPDENITVGVMASSAYNDAGGDSVDITDDPPVVTVAKAADATEGGTDGKFTFTRSGGDLTQSLTVTYDVSGTATDGGTDYTTLGGTVTFGANKTTADVSVTAAPDTTYDPDETVVVTISGTGMEYTAGTADSATVVIHDDASSTFSENGLVGTLWYDLAWEDVDPDEASQSLPLSNFRLLVNGELSTASRTDIVFDTSPVAVFQYGVLTGISVAIDTSGVVGFAYSSISVSGWLLSAYDALTSTTTTATMVDFGSATLDFTNARNTAETTWTAEFTLTAEDEVGAPLENSIKIEKVFAGTATAAEIVNEFKLAFEAKGFVPAVTPDGKSLTVAGTAELRLRTMTYKTSRKMVNQMWGYDRTMNAPEHKAGALNTSVYINPMVP